MSNQCSVHGVNASPTQVLKDEHRVIEKVLDATKRALRHTSIDRSFFEKALDFLRNFADGCHHAKEEDELFPALEKSGIPRDGGPIGCMLKEHEEGRSFVRTIADNLEAAAGGNRVAEGVLRQAAEGYVELLREHIQKEDNVLFVLADQALGPDEQKLLLAAFDLAERSNGNCRKHEQYVALADELSQWTFSTV